MKVIDDFRKEYFFLSNFYAWAPLVWEGVKYPSSEHAFQAAKTLDQSIRRMIAGLSTCRSAKINGNDRSIITLREGWDDGVSLQCMYEIVKAKFEQNDKILVRLLATDDATLIEGNTWHDNFWGDCRCSKCESKVGQNNLGLIIMRVRSEFSLAA